MSVISNVFNYFTPGFGSRFLKEVNRFYAIAREELLNEFPETIQSIDKRI